MASMQPDLGALYLRHREAMYRVASSVLREEGRASEAADVVQDAIVSIMQSLPKNVHNWEALLVQITKWKAIDRIRSAEVRHAGPEFDPSVHDRAGETSIAEDVIEDLDRVQRAELARKCLGILEERHRTAVWQTIALGRPRREVAVELGVSPSRVSQMTTRSLAQLRQEMSRREGENDECREA